MKTRSPFFCAPAFVVTPKLEKSIEGADWLWVGHSLGQLVFQRIGQGWRTGGGDGRALPLPTGTARPDSEQRTSSAPSRSGGGAGAPRRMSAIGGVGGVGGVGAPHSSRGGVCPWPAHWAGTSNLRSSRSRRL